MLGICVGMQWLFDGSAEAPGHPGLELLPGTCSLITDEDDGSDAFKVPHVGWNSLHRTRDSWLLEGVDEGDQVYFTHSYAAPVTGSCVGSTRYGVEFAAAVERGVVGGVQFHPEKSSDVGLRILRNFLRRVPA
jgi:glutamine amidotransferase